MFVVGILYIMEWLEGLNCDYLTHPQHEPSIGVRYKWVGGVVCVCDLHLQPCRSNAGCMWNCYMLDVIRAWLELLMGRVSESRREADCHIHAHIEVT